MFDRRRDDMVSFGLQQPRQAEDCQVVALRSPAGKNHFAWFASEDPRHSVAGIVQNRTRLATYMMNARWISPDFTEERQHGVTHGRVERRGRVVVEVNCFHREG